MHTESKLGNSLLEEALAIASSAEDDHCRFNRFIAELAKDASPSFYAFLVWTPGNDQLGVRHADSFHRVSEGVRYEWATSLIEFVDGTQEPLTGIVFKSETSSVLKVICDWDPSSDNCNIDTNAHPKNTSWVVLKSIADYRKKVDDIYTRHAKTQKSKEAMNEIDSLVLEMGNKIEKKLEHYFDNARLENTFDSQIRDFIWSLFWNRLISSNWKYLYYIPSAIGSEKSKGGLVLATKYELPDHSIVNAKAVITILSAGPERKSLEGEWRKELQRAAHAALRASRAAVFARNFSHITGSHIVSNPQFRHSLAGNELLRSFRSRLDQNIDRFRAAENDLFLYMFDANKKPEDVFSAAAKELADIRDKLYTGDVLLENTRRFHEYLQGRFDFIARAIDDLRDQLEPVWFVKDLLEGFLSQTAYLDNLVADVGLRRDDMEFFLRIGAKDHNAEYVARWAPQVEATDSVQYPLEVIWEKSDNKGVRIRPEKMVSLPGGMGSAHAFYSLLENIIRNSAKYGTLKEEKVKQGKKYRLTVQISPMSSKGHPSYQLVSIWDNYSTAKHETTPIFKIIQAKLEKNFVRNDGQAEGDDLGMMEMQACAKFLCRENDDLYPGERPPHVINENALPEERRRFNLWTSSLEESQEIDSNNPPLVFQMAFNKTTLMACCTPKAKVQANSREFELICWLEKISEVIDLSPFLLVLDGSEFSSDIVVALAQDQTAYPQRIVVVCTDEVQLIEWTESLGRNTPGECRLPHRRIVCLLDKDIYNNIFPDTQDYDEEDAILAGYEAWLKAWKPPPPNHNLVNPAEKESLQWHLWIGLQRQGTQVKEAWGKADKYFLDDRLVNVMVASFSANDIEPFKTGFIEKVYADSEEKYWQDEKRAQNNSKKALVFDNHGNCFQAAQVGIDPLSKSTRFYQKLSGSISPELFRILSSPPQDKFSFKFFVYSLVESCLTNVLVVDERLAMTLLEGRSDGKTNENFSSDLLEHQNAGIYPVFRFRHESNKEEIGFYTERHRERLATIIANNISESKSTDMMDQEGVIFNLNDISKSRSNVLTYVTDENVGNEKRFGFCEGLNADVLLIHEGAMDILVAEGVDWKEAENQKQLVKQLQALYQLAPMIIRTSGRGRKSKLLGEHLPFIEFTQVSSALLTARNKFSLVRALLGSVGRAMR
jgi:hypothetical protein